MKKSHLFGALCGCAFMCQGVNTAESASVTYTNETDFLFAAGATSSFLRIDAGSTSHAAFTLSFNLAAPTAFVRFWVTGFGDGGAGNLSFTNNAGDSFVIASSPLSNGNELFFGSGLPGLIGVARSKV